MIIKIPEHQFEDRRLRLFQKMDELNLKHFFIINPYSIYYLTGFSMIPTERPFILIFKETETIFFVPELEKQHVQEKVPYSHVHSYFEYPDEVHPMHHFARFVKNDLKMSNRIGCEAAGARGIWGYQGPSFSDVLKKDIPIYPEIITDMRIIKDNYELECIHEAARWGHLAHELLQKYTAIGENEIEVSFKASHEASRKMREVLGSDYSPIGYGARPCGAGYRGQIGSYSAIPHALTRNAIFQKGDTLVTGASGNVAGYLSELERTMFLGEPNQKQKDYFWIMLKAQSAAIEELRPYNPLSKVDQATRKVFKEAGVFSLVQHHTGHAIGLEAHERPFLDIGMKETIKPGMVFTVEPGIYDRAVGGFRHSDTVIITEDGNEVVTVKYPRDLESLIIEC
ncbi:M24 family metallopeptidase [Candidatus Hodarchaeum mangrovi]